MPNLEDLVEEVLYETEQEAVRDQSMSCPPLCTWMPATSADVARDGNISRCRSLRRCPGRTEVQDIHHGRHWRFRGVSRTTDPDLTTFTKDVRGWICHLQPAPATISAIGLGGCSPRVPIISHDLQLNLATSDKGTIIANLH